MPRRFPLDQLTLANYAETFRVVPFSRYFLNSTIVTISVTVLQILISSLAAFAFARLRFHGREALFLLYLATLMIPAQVTSIPRLPHHQELALVRHLYGADRPRDVSHHAEHIPAAPILPAGIPLDLDEATRMDGASSFRIWLQVIVPCGGVMAALAIFTFQATWNDFLWPLVVTGSDEMRTIPIGLSYFVASTARPGTC